MSKRATKRELVPGLHMTCPKGQPWIKLRPWAPKNYLVMDSISFFGIAYHSSLMSYPQITCTGGTNFVSINLISSVNQLQLQLQLQVLSVGIGLFLLNNNHSSQFESPERIKN